MCLDDRTASQADFVPTTIDRLSIGSMADMPVYDLSGRRLGPWDTLPAGIYVVRMNGQQYKLRK